MDGHIDALQSGSHTPFMQRGQPNGGAPCVHVPASTPHDPLELLLDALELLLDALELLLDALELLLLVVVALELLVAPPVPAPPVPATCRSLSWARI
jgi:hypothetical protein